ncbi:hypothetical protein ACHAW5_005427 [Stephanodiscus triporus]|uniref:AMP-dependent synthetase/ligase domain-containing protein n=1 Tax=Stephanodiscus triporus TaxID=2934178 RepID=A0ABD3P4X4_9STRA
MSDRDVVSHVVYTSGTTGRPKGCVSSLASLRHYLRVKNTSHGITRTSRVLLASAVTFDPCLSDVLATCAANGVLCLASRGRMYGRGDDDDDESDDGGGGCAAGGGLAGVLAQLRASHVLCTPALWSTMEGRGPDDFPHLKVVALGGEPIPRSIVARWARRCPGDEGESFDRRRPRLCATYGVTEACVYQTFGEVLFAESSSSSSCGGGGGVVVNNEDRGDEGGGRRSSTTPGANVGLPLPGTNVHICRPRPEDDVENNDEWGDAATLERDGGSLAPEIGEVVISGAQVDAISSYLNSAELTSRVFVRCPADGACSGGKDSHFYRTGDLGCIDPATGNLHILGRIKDGMVKINGMRIELSEIENACIDDASDNEGRLVMDCVAAVSGSSTDDSAHQCKQLIAYCLLSSASLSELGISFNDEQISGYHEAELSSIPNGVSRRTAGIIVGPGPLLSLLRARCDRRVRRGCTPRFFVLIDRLPLSPTGKRCRSTLPPLFACSIMNSSGNSNEKKSLWECGRVGSIVANKICECLNLQPCQRQLVTLDSNFFALGGDSLAATRVVRGLYAKHHGILDNRNLGGGTGTLDGPFSAKFLLKSETLGAYIEFLVSKSAFQTSDDAVTAIDGNEFEPTYTSDHNVKENVLDPLYASLLESITLGYARVAGSFLDLGVDPNTQHGQGRLGKVSDRQQQRTLFKSNPLHLACLRGNPYLVRKLLDRGCKANTPDASGSFPIHLACSRIEDNVSDAAEDLKR